MLVLFWEYMFLDSKKNTFHLYKDSYKFVCLSCLLKKYIASVEPGKGKGTTNEVLPQGSPNEALPINVSPK